MGAAEIGNALDGGDIATTDGAVVGEHSGLHRYTIGQRRGIGISSPEPLYVVKIDVPLHRLVVGKRSELYSSGFVAGGVNWVSIAPPDHSLRAEVRFAIARPAPATIIKVGTSEARVEFDSPQAR
jgi:tRNA-specific 2-thiouridylase